MKKIDRSKIYDVSSKYWENIPPTVDGMLGGFGYISETDIKGSEVFLKSLFLEKPKIGRKVACDCGAGIGRITKKLLSKYFTTVDLVELNEGFLNQSKLYLSGVSNIGKRIAIGLQNFKPEKSRYDVIWCQWVLGYLTNDDLFRLFRRLRLGLHSSGAVIVKENIASGDEEEIDPSDGCITRPLVDFHTLMKKAGYEIVLEETQKKFPKGLFEVRMFALSVQNDVEKNGV